MHTLKLLDTQNTFYSKTPKPVLMWWLMTDMWHYIVYERGWEYKFQSKRDFKLQSKNIHNIQNTNMKKRV